VRQKDVLLTLFDIAVDIPIVCCHSPRCSPARSPQSQRCRHRPPAERAADTLISFHRIHLQPLSAINHGPRTTANVASHESEKITCSFPTFCRETMVRCRDRPPSCAWYLQKACMHCIATNWNICRHRVSTRLDMNYCFSTARLLLFATRA
jgi:hypothetical protein